ncbi:MAG: HsdR family type I site-specific deoxyribonuclease [Chitinophagales bacterium]|nr:HsdR family type I site-specific deoxyribonuclease [Chitinophagales bacterium]
MIPSPRNERQTQKRVIALFESLGYTYLGDWSKRNHNRPIETAMLRNNLLRRGYTAAQVSAVLEELAKASDCTGTTLYNANRRTYPLLRYPISIKTAIDEPYQSIRLIDWDNMDNNDFGIAEEVTLKNEGYERRPDLVLYINGIAVGIIELKRSSVNIAEGIRQLITNQEESFNPFFFTTVQLVFAGNDSQGLWYGTVGTPEQFFVQWKDQSPSYTTPVVGEFLDKPLVQMCNKNTLLDLIRHCVIFDGGYKKVPRQHQYDGFKAAQERIRRREGGVIWHTQGSGKSILMVLLAKWILEYDPDGRVLIITDRDELDRQIEGVMQKTGIIDENTNSVRITSREQFVRSISASAPRLLCSLIHKFDTTDLTGTPPKVNGKFYVFVDECHRTQGGDMNKQMKRWLPNAIFIGFTGTPLLRKDKQTTREVFGTYIHTYKFPQAVADKVVLDLKYEARDVPQQLTSRQKIDDWFALKTKNLNNFQKAVLRKKWANMEKLMSSSERKNRIIASIIEDFNTKPRLDINNEGNRGTAILVAASIYDACHYFRLFQINNDFGSYCAIITSYEPNQNNISREPKGSDERYKFDTYTNHVLQDGQTTTQYEEEMKRRFRDEPNNCKLLIVVSKLLTGFDAPSCTYIYLDNELHDHTLFQAICRTNRLDGDDKEYGYIVDFKELFKDVQDAIAVYSSDELDTEGAGEMGNNIEIKNWLVEGKRHLDMTREKLKHLCEPVAPPQQTEQFLVYFCGDANSPLSLSETEVLRISFYKMTASYIRAYSDIAQHLLEAGYTLAEAAAIEQETVFYASIRSDIKYYSGEELDIKPYEGDMRYLINTYIRAEDAAKLGEMDNYSLVDLIVETGIHDAIARKLNEKSNLSNNAVAEGIINNIRKTIIREQLTDPRFYSEMSQLLDDLITQKRTSAEEYEAFLKKAEELVQKLDKGHNTDQVPIALKGKAAAIVIYNNLSDILAKTSAAGANEPAADYGSDSLVNLALKIDTTMREQAHGDWRGHETRERQIQNVLFDIMKRNKAATQAIFNLLKNMKGYA